MFYDISDIQLTGQHMVDMCHDHKGMHSSFFYPYKQHRVSKIGWDGKREMERERRGKREMGRGKREREREGKREREMGRRKREREEIEISSSRLLFDLPLMQTL